MFEVVIVVAVMNVEVVEASTVRDQLGGNSAQVTCPLPPCVTVTVFAPVPPASPAQISRWSAPVLTTVAFCAYDVDTVSARDGGPATLYHATETIRMSPLVTGNPLLKTNVMLPDAPP